jgi:predicted dehydrogenase
VRGTIARVDRREPDFMYGTAIHPLDAMRKIAGDVRDHEVDARKVGGVQWFVIRFAFESGALGVLEVLPTAGHNAESYEFAGEGYGVHVGAGENDSGQVRCWEKGQLVMEREPAQGLPGYARNGAYDETVAFLSALKEGRGPHPSPSEVLQSVELCHLIQEEALGDTV